MGSRTWSAGFAVWNRLVRNGRACMKSAATQEQRGLRHLGSQVSQCVLHPYLKWLQSIRSNANRRKYIRACACSFPSVLLDSCCLVRSLATEESQARTLKYAKRQAWQCMDRTHASICFIQHPIFPRMRPLFLQLKP